MERVEVTFARRDAGSEDGFTDLFFEAGETALITKKLADLFSRTGALVPEDENEGGEPPGSGDNDRGGDSEGGGGLKDKLGYNSDSGSGSGSGETSTSGSVKVSKSF